MTELETFLAMLDRSGTRYKITHYSTGTFVTIQYRSSGMVSVGPDKNPYGDFMIDFYFKPEGLLLDVTSCD
jgi:hypothetical protein